MKKNLTEDPLARSRLRATQYQHIDGAFELTFGGAVLLMAVGFYVVNRVAAADASFSSSPLYFAPLVAFVGGAYLIDALVRRLRLRVTYPRTGYIAYQKPQPFKRSTRLIIWLSVSPLIVIVLALLFLNRPMFQTQTQNLDYNPIMTLFSGLLFTGLWAVIGWKIALPRFYFIAGVTFLVSVGLLFNGAGVMTSMVVLCGVMGLSLCVTGGLTLVRYLRMNPAPQETADER